MDIDSIIANLIKYLKKEQWQDVQNPYSHKVHLCIDVPTGDESGPLFPRNDELYFEDEYGKKQVRSFGEELNLGRAVRGAIMREFGFVEVQNTRQERANFSDEEWQQRLENTPPLAVTFGLSKSGGTTINLWGSSNRILLERAKKSFEAAQKSAPPPPKPADEPWVPNDEELGHYLEQVYGDKQPQHSGALAVNAPEP